MGGSHTVEFWGVDTPSVASLKSWPLGCVVSFFVCRSTPCPPFVFPPPHPPPHLLSTENGLVVLGSQLATWSPTPPVAPSI